MLFIFKIFILVVGFFVIVPIIPFFKKNLKLVIFAEDYLFIPSLIFWFVSLQLFIMWFFGTIVFLLVHSQVVVIKFLEVLLFSGMILNLFYIIVVGLKLNFKYKTRNIDEA